MSEGGIAAQHPLQFSFELGVGVEGLLVLVVVIDSGVLGLSLDFGASIEGPSHLL